MASAENKKVAVVLSGCGVYDGTEIQEAVFALNHLSKLKCEVKCFAPNKEQHHVVRGNVVISKLKCYCIIII
jgi:enhancing lycopene biosynthesis protein 2